MDGDSGSKRGRNPGSPYLCQRPIGNLVLANDGKITIAIGAVAGAGNGNGTLTILNAGTFASGTANAVVVGLSLGGPVGNGLVDIQDGTFLMNAASGTAMSGLGLGVGIDTGATGVVNVGDGSGAAGSAVLNLSTNNAILSIGGIFQTATGGSGTVTINSDGALTAGTAGITVGDGAGSYGKLELIAGGTLSIGTGSIIVGRGGNGVSIAHPNGLEFIVAGTVVSGGQIRIGGASGTGAMTMTAGALTTSGETFVGMDGGSGTVTLGGGVATINNQLNIGRNSTSASTFTQTGGTLAVQNEIRIGAKYGGETAGTGTFTMSGGTATSGGVTYFGEGAGSLGTLNLSGNGAMTANGEFWVGNDNGGGVANITGGSITANQWFDIGRNSGTGTVNLSGTGSITKLTGTGTVDIGSSGSGQGTLNQTGGTLTNTVSDTIVGRENTSVGVWNLSGGTATLATLIIARDNGTTGTMNFTGGTMTPLTGNLLVGAAGNGTLNVTGAAAVTLSANQILVGGQYGASGNGTINISNPNAVITSRNEAGIGRNGGHGEVHQSAGIVNVGGGWFGIANDGGSGVSGLYDITGGRLNVNAGTVELGADGQGELRITGTGTVTARDIHVSQRGGGTGTLNVGGSATLTATGQIVIGYGSGNANVANASGGTVTSGNETRVGEGNGHTGTLNISGTTAWTSGGELQVGNDGGSGVMNMSGGTMTINQWGAIGRNGGTGVVNLSGGTIQMGGANRSFDIGVFGGSGVALGTGTLTQTGGTLVNTGNDTSIGRDASGVGFWNMSAGTATLTGRNLIVGNRGNGTLNLTGGTISGVNQFNVGGNGGSTGLANINFVNPLDTLTVNEIYVAYGGGSTGTINVSRGTLKLNGWSEIGRNGANGVVNVTGSNAHFVGSNSDMQIGYGNGGIGNINITAGGTFSHNSWVNLGRNGNGNGTITVDGAGSMFSQTNGRLNIGGDPNDGNGKGIGLVEVKNGGLYNKTNGDELNLGTNATSVGTLNVSTGGTFNVGNVQKAVGRNGGTGTINVFSGGTFTGGNGGDMQVGLNNGSTGNVNITTGGQMSVGWWLNIARGGGSTGHVTVNGAGSTLTQTVGGLNVGEDGTGTLDITNNGVVNHHTTSQDGDNEAFSVARNNNSTGTVTIATGGHLNLGDRAYIGRSGGSTGTLNVSGAGSQVNAFLAGGGDFFHVAAGGSHGNVSVSAGGTINTNSGWFTMGEGDGAVGIATLSGTGSSIASQGLIVGWNGNSSSTLTIDNNAIYTNTSGREVSIARDNANTQGTVNINSGGILNANRDARIGANGIGRLNMNGGTFNSAGGWLYVGDGGSSNGFVNMVGASTFNHPNDSLMVANNNGAHGTFTQAGTSVTNIGGELNIGRSGGIGAVNVNGGTFNVNGWTTMGRDGNNGTGALTVSNGGIFNHVIANGNQDFLIGWTNGSTGSVTVTTAGVVNYNAQTRVGVDGGATGSVSVDGAGSAFNVTAGDALIGENGTGSLTVTNGGLFNAVNNVYIGRTGPGTLNLSSGGVVSANTVRVAQDAASTGTINAVGGTIFANSINVISGTAAVSFAAGTFKAKSDTYNPFVNFNTANSELNTGGVIVDTNGHALSWTNTFDGGGAITKTGNGNLLVGSSTAHTGGVAVNQGSLTINETSAIGTGNVVINGGRVVIAPMGLSEGHILGNSFDTATANPGGAYRISQDRANSTDAAAFGDNSTWVYTGKFVVTGNTPVTWTFAEQFDDNVRLAVDGNVGIVDGASWNTPTNYTTTLNPGVHTFEVRLGQGGGGVGPNSGWALGFGYDPQGRNDLDPTHFQSFADVTGDFLFHDFAGTTTVTNNVVLNVASSEVKVPVAGMTSLISGAVSGPGGLTKTGNGKLKLNSANSYLGGTAISGGTLNINADASLGGAAGGVTITNNATLQAEASVTTNRTITLGTGGGTIDTNGQAVTLGGTVTGTSLTEAGSGVLNINGIQTYNSLTTTGGVTNIYTALGTGTSAITANATLNVYASQTLASLTIADGVEVTFGDGLSFAPAPVKFGAPGVVPEPGSLGLLIVGALGLVRRRRRAN